MKNYNLYKKHLSVFLAISIIIFSFYQSYFISYAITESERDLVLDIGKSLLDFLEEFGNTLVYAASQCGAFVTNDFEKWLLNNEKYKNFWKDKYFTSSDDTDEEQVNYITINQYTKEVNFSEDFLSDIKQALKEYNEETNGYFLISTMSLSAMSPSDFRTRSTYQTVYNLVNEKGILGVYVNNSYSYAEQKSVDVCYFADLSDFTKDGYNFVLDQRYTNIDNIINNTPCNIVCIAYDSDWQFTGFGHYVYNNYLESTYAVSSFDDMDYIYYEDDTIYYGSYVHNTSHFMIQNYKRDSNVVSASYYNTQGGTSINVVTPHGDRVRVFKDLNALKYYSVDKRTVYFGSDFYNKEPTEITLTIDDLDKYMNMDFDKYFGELQDTIISQGSNLSEADVEKLTDSLLGKLNDINNNIGNVGESVQETNNLLSQILSKLDNLDKNVASILENLDNKVSSTLNIDFSGIEERIDLIIEYLNKLKNFTILDTVFDGVDAVGDIVDFIKDLFSDVDGVADTALGSLLDALDGGTSLLSKKFPFSVPWDLLFFITMLASEPEVPHFDIPIDFSISALGIDVHYDFAIDFTDYQFLSDICRTILSMTYCVGLIKLTPGVVNIKKEE